MNILQQRINRWSKVGILTTFILYVVAIISLTLFPIPPVTPEELVILKQYAHFFRMNNLIPFHSIWNMIHAIANPITKFKNIIGNILLFVPFGVLVPYLLKTKISFPRMLIYGFLFSLWIELTQLGISLYLGYYYRAFDVDDLLLNTLGASMGYGIYSLIQPIFAQSKWTWKKTLVLFIGLVAVYELLDLSGI